MNHRNNAFQEFPSPNKIQVIIKRARIIYGSGQHAPFTELSGYLLNLAVVTVLRHSN